MAEWHSGRVHALDAGGLGFESQSSIFCIFKKWIKKCGASVFTARAYARAVLGVLILSVHSASLGVGFLTCSYQR